MARELTKEEKDEYNRLIRGAVQIRLNFEIHNKNAVQKPDIVKCSDMLNREK